MEVVDATLYDYYDYNALEEGKGAGRGYIKISLAEDWDPEGFVKFEVDLPNIETFKEDG